MSTEKVNFTEVLASINEALKDGVPKDQILRDVEAAIEAMVLVLGTVMGPKVLVDTMKRALKEMLVEFVEREAEKTSPGR